MIFACTEAAENTAPDIYYLPTQGAGSYLIGTLEAGDSASRLPDQRPFLTSEPSFGHVTFYRPLDRVPTADEAVSTASLMGGPGVVRRPNAFADGFSR